MVANCFIDSNIVGVCNGQLHQVLKDYRLMFKNYLKIADISALNITPVFMKTAKYAATALAIALILTECTKHESTPSKAELLTGNSNKSWNISFSSYDEIETDESCKAVNSFNADNVWTFKTNGTFEFNNGSVHTI